MWRSLLTEYGMILVLLLLVVSFSVLTVTDTQNTGAAAGQELSAAIEAPPANSCAPITMRRRS